MLTPDSSIALGGVHIAWVRVTEPTRRRELARRLLRDLVSDVTGHRPGGVGLRQVCRACGGPHGPIVATLPYGDGPAVSLSYTGSLAFAGVAVGAPSLGIDAEGDTARNATAATEGLGALGLPGGDLTQWTRLEALAKALGTGLRADLSGVAFVSSSRDGDVRRWRATGVPGAATVEGFDLSLRLDPVPVLLSVALTGQVAGPADRCRAASAATPPPAAPG